MIRNVIYNFILLGLLILFSADVVFACSCVADPPRANIEFIGQVIDIKEDTLHGQYEVTFKIIENRRGAKREEITVKTAIEGAECGYTFEMDEFYQVFVDVIIGEFRTGLCYGNKQLLIIDNEANSENKKSEEEGPGIIIESGFEE